MSDGAMREMIWECTKHGRQHMICGLCTLQEFDAMKAKIQSLESMNDKAFSLNTELIKSNDLLKSKLALAKEALEKIEKLPCGYCINWNIAGEALAALSPKPEDKP